MPFFQQNVSTQGMVGPMFTTANIPTTALTTANLSLIFQNGGLVTTLSCTSVVAKTGGFYQVDLSSSIFANLGRIWYAPVSTVGQLGAYVLDGEVMIAANYNLLYGSSAIANVLSSVNWNSETSRLLTSDAVAAAAVWSATTRNLTSFGVTLGADVWAVTTRTLSSIENIVQGVWEEVITTHTLANSFGKLWTDMTTGTTYQFTSNALSKGLSTFAAADVWSVASRTLTSWGGISTVTPSTIAAADVWAVTTRSLTTGLNVAADVWQVSTRTLTSGQAAADAVWANTSRTLTSWGGISTVTPSTISPTDVWSAATRTLTSAGQVATDVWGAAADGTLTYGQWAKLSIGVNLSNSTGGGTTAIAFRNWASTKDRVSYTVTTVGNRVVTTYDLT